MAPQLLILFGNRAFLGCFYFLLGWARSGILRWSGLILQKSQLYLALNPFPGYVRIDTFDKMIAIYPLPGWIGHRLRRHASVQLDLRVEEGSWALLQFWGLMMFLLLEMTWLLCLAEGEILLRTGEDPGGKRLEGTCDGAQHFVWRVWTGVPVRDF